MNAKGAARTCKPPKSRIGMLTSPKTSNSNPESEMNFCYFLTDSIKLKLNLPKIQIKSY